jgi:hypothetical protein
MKWVDCLKWSKTIQDKDDFAIEEHVEINIFITSLQKPLV